MSAARGPGSSRLQVEAVVDSLELGASGRWRWLGRPMAGLPRTTIERLNDEEQRGILRDQITNCLYRFFYTRGRPTHPDGPSAPAASPSPAVRAMSDRAQGRRSWSGGWEIVSRTERRVQLRRHGILIAASNGTVIDDPDQPGRARVLIPGLSERISPGFLLLRGNLDLEAKPDEARLRLYWNVQEGGVLELFSRLTAALDEADLPYRFKVARHLESDPRCDAAVLYFRADDWSAVGPRTAAIGERLAPWLGSGTPGFTLALAPGLALAEDPADGESFGRSRSALLADGLLDAHAQEIDDKSEQLEFVLEAIRKRDYDPDALHLGPSSTGSYTFPEATRPDAADLVDRAPTGPDSTAVRVERSRNERDERVRSDTTPWRADESLEVACRIGEDLVARAWWHGEKCTWVGATPVPRPDGRGRGPETWVSLGADIYGGLAGVAFFLAELNAVAPHPELARTARGALALSLETDDQASGPGGGLYTGSLGAALVQARVARLGDDRKAMSQALDRAHRAATELRSDPHPDLLSGKAGGIIGLLAIAALSHDDALVEVARNLGDQLVDSAVSRDGGRAWGAPSGAWPLTGYSHGTGGILHALAELDAYTGRTRFRELVLDALRYEDEMYDTRAGNWPDFRLEPGAPVLPRGEYPTGSLWCHGAPGVLAGRRRVHVVLEGAEPGEGLERARQATLADVAPQALDPIGTWCLCHGVAGNAWTLVHGGPVALATEAERHAAARVVRAGAERHQDPGSWPCGVGGGWSPAYMVGVAGAGALYLGLARPETPSFLIPIPEMFARG